MDGYLLSRLHNFETKQICHPGVFIDNFARIDFGPGEYILSFLYPLKKTKTKNALWPLFMDGVQLP